MADPIKWKMTQEIAAANLSNQTFFYSIENEQPVLIMSLPKDANLALLLGENANLLGLNVRPKDFDGRERTPPTAYTQYPFNRDDIVKLIKAGVRDRAGVLDAVAEAMGIEQPNKFAKKAREA